MFVHPRGRNVDANLKAIESAGGSARAEELWWGEEGLKTSPLSQLEQPFDFIVGSDLIYDHDVHEYLLWSMHKVRCGGVQPLVAFLCTMPALSGRRRRQISGGSIHWAYSPIDFSHTLDSS